ncbi:MAG: hypothetical protein ACWA44_06175 [Thiotrichales bacterium]
MPLSPGILALLIVTATSSLVFIYLSVLSLKIAISWDFTKSSSRQLELEKRTQLAATLVSFILLSELLSLLLFVYNAESMSSLFVGAMCATGVLNVNHWGWPALFAKTAIFFLGGIWVAINWLDNRCRDYPLTRLKYSFLLAIAPVIFFETYAQMAFFLHMDPNIITSCCGSLFSSDSSSVAGEISGMPASTSIKLFLLSAGLIFSTGLGLLRFRQLAPVFGILAIFTFIVSLMSIVSFISGFVYEHPNHHCPFCILKAGHGYSGYFLYIPLFIATLLALVAAAFELLSRHHSVAAIISTARPHLIFSALLFYLLFYSVTGWLIFKSSLTLENIW